MGTGELVTSGDLPDGRWDDTPSRDGAVAGAAVACP